MPPSIPTHRPLVTATRSAILIAIAAVTCSAFLMADDAYGRMATAALVPGNACVGAEHATAAGHAAGTVSSTLVSRDDARTLPLR
jgi:hypothetical protein